MWISPADRSYLHMESEPKRIASADRDHVLRQRFGEGAAAPSVVTFNALCNCEIAHTTADVKRHIMASESETCRSCNLPLPPGLVSVADLRVLVLL